MTVAYSARRTASRASRSRALEALTRVGFVGYGLLHLAVAWLAAQIALGHAAEGDQSGAFHYLADQPFGRFLLIVTAVGLAAMALWQLLLAAVGHQAERGLSRTAERVASAARAIIYAALAWTAYKVVSGTSTSNAQQTQDATAGLMAKPAGQWLVALAGLVVLAIGVGMAVYGARRTFERKLLMGQMSNNVRRLARRLGQVGYIAKGAAFAIMGILLLDAAASHNPAKSRGLDSALHALVDQPYGVFLLILIAFGFAAFGVYCFFQSRYRRVTA